ncbi:MAG: hypothetical protein R3B97_14045 [Dehalococcoidia bacterium]
MRRLYYPGTPIAAIEESLSDVDQVTVMTINPGWGGQGMIPAQLEKVRRLRAALDALVSNAEIMIDGGVKTSNAAQCAAAGASILVCGSSVYGPGAQLRKISPVCARLSVSGTFATTLCVLHRVWCGPGTRSTA